MNEIECGEYYFKTGKVPPVNLHSWVSVYNIVVNAGFDKIFSKKIINKSPDK